MSLTRFAHRGVVLHPACWRQGRMCQYANLRHIIIPSHMKSSISFFVLFLQFVCVRVSLFFSFLFLLHSWIQVLWCSREIWNLYNQIIPDISKDATHNKDKWLTHKSLQELHFAGLHSVCWWVERKCPCGNLSSYVFFSHRTKWIFPMTLKTFAVRV